MLVRSLPCGQLTVAASCRTGRNGTARASSMPSSPLTVATILAVRTRAFVSA